MYTRMAREVQLSSLFLIELPTCVPIFELSALQPTCRYFDRVLHNYEISIVRSNVILSAVRRQMEFLAHVN
ncbi:hypothetical protein Mapa_000904 [Marchantia paleacea]|nr:hypothetical protein Mapa_000904 [Marchantia paleacea]